jgi:hypothetical protein
MPTREEILAFVKRLFDQVVRSPSDVWIAMYCLLLDYIYGVPRITDSNRLKKGSSWRNRAELVEAELAKALGCDSADLHSRVNLLMKGLYRRKTQKMNPSGIAFACACVIALQRFGSRAYSYKIEARIGEDVFPRLTSFRRKSVDIVGFLGTSPFAVISSKLGMRHDRIRDPQEEADTYKREQPGLKSFLATSEFDKARLSKLIQYPSIDGVFHVNIEILLRMHKPDDLRLRGVIDMTDLFKAL